MKIALVVGTRPNFVKAAAVLTALTRRGAPSLLIHTGQHFDAALSDAFFRRLELPRPDYHLGVGAGSRGEQFGEITRELAQLLPKTGATKLVVVGDVTSTAAAAVAGDACDLPVAHVEAGLRSFDMSMPEERNRKIADALASQHFVSEPSGIKNLMNEGVRAETTHLVGNVMIDTLMRFRKEAFAQAPWTKHGLGVHDYAVATLHRPSNVDSKDALEEALAVLGLVAENWPVLFAAHPRTTARLSTYGLSIPSQVRLLPPLDYLEFIGLMAGAKIVLTDSGGAQEETTVLDVPCLTMRENTERPITVESGSSRLIGRSAKLAREYVAEISKGTFPHASPIPLWDGQAGERIAALLLA